MSLDSAHVSMTGTSTRPQRATESRAGESRRRQLDEEWTRETPGEPRGRGRVAGTG